MKSELIKFGRFELHLVPDVDILRFTMILRHYIKLLGTRNLPVLDGILDKLFAKGL